MPQMIKRMIRKLVLGYRNSSEDYIERFRSIGAEIGEGTVVFYPLKTFIDETRPFLIRIGKNVQITKGVTILTHGYDWSVLKGVFGEVLGSAGRVSIGDNVFIGMNSTILKGVSIGDNVIIGANSLVNKDIPNNVVCAGNPAKVIMTIDDYYKKRKEMQIKEAQIIYNEYIRAYKKEPSMEVFDEFFWLFFPRNEELPKAFQKQMKNVGNYKISMEKFLMTKPLYNGYDEFLKVLKNRTELV